MLYICSTAFCPTNPETVKGLEMETPLWNGQQNSTEELASSRQTLIQFGKVTLWWQEVSSQLGRAMAPQFGCSASWWQPLLFFQRFKLLKLCDGIYFFLGCVFCLSRVQCVHPYLPTESLMVLYRRARCSLMLPLFISRSNSAFWIWSCSCVVAAAAVTVLGNVTGVQIAWVSTASGR